MPAIISSIAQCHNNGFKSSSQHMLKAASAYQREEQVAQWATQNEGRLVPPPRGETRCLCLGEQLLQVIRRQDCCYAAAAALAATARRAAATPPTALPPPPPPLLPPREPSAGGAEKVTAPQPPNSSAAAFRIGAVRLLGVGQKRRACKFCTLLGDCLRLHVNQRVNYAHAFA